MPIDDSRVIWNAIGEPPESPWGYAQRNGISESEVPQSVFKAWRDWNTKEQALVEKAAEHSGGKSYEEVLTDLGYRNEPDAGKSMFSRYSSGGEKSGVLETIQKDAWDRTIAAGHATWDPTRNAYINIGTGTAENPSQIWNKEGRIISGDGYKATGTLRPVVSAILRNAGVPKNYSLNSGYKSSGGFKPPTVNMGGFGPTVPAGTRESPQQPTGPKRGDAGYRPMLKTDPNNTNYGAWGYAYNKPRKIGSAYKMPTNTFGYQPANGMGGY